MDYVKKFLHVEGVIGQGAFGRVLVTSPLQNQVQLPHLPQPLQLTNGQLSPPGSEGSSGLTKTTPNDEQLNLQPLSTQRSASCGRLTDKINNTYASGGGVRFALKCVHPILKPQRLASELRHLRDLGGRCNVVQMHTAHLYMGSLYIVMELIEHDRFVDIVAQLEYTEIRDYIKNLLIALEYVHSHNIMHRDIKPANFLYNRKHRKFLLVDFGLAQLVRNKNSPQGARNPSTPINTTPKSTSYANSIKLMASPRTPTSTSRRLITPLFPEAHDQLNKSNFQKDKQQISIIAPNSSFVNLSSTHMLNQSPVRHYINLTPAGSPSVPNVSTKRHLPETLKSGDLDQMMLKKLRVSNHDDTKEPVKLTVGAYESPITHNDPSTKRGLKNRQNQGFSTPKETSSSRNSGSRCDCRGKPKTCNICMGRPDSSAPKSGTPGYKAPEILLRYANQTTAIDIWSAGVIFACLLSGHSPFFRDVEDIVSLAEVITILGSHRVYLAAKALGIRLTVKPEREPIDLMQLCRSIRQNGKDKKQINIPDSAFGLLKRMLDPNPMTRITASEALQYSWFQENSTTV